MNSVIKQIADDARTEWSLRWTALTMISYALLFYNTGRPQPWFDWALLIQLVQGGNLAFYNYGWHYWFGLMAAIGLVIGGCFVSIIYTSFLQKDDLWQGYLIIMSLLSVLIAPCAVHLGVLSSLNGIALLVIVIFVENIYVPILNLRTVLPDVKSIWTEVIRGSVYPALVYVGLSWGIYLFPPWHSGTTQSLRIASGTAFGISASLNAAAKVFSCSSDSSDEEDKESEGNNVNGENNSERHQKRKEALQDIGSSLFRGTNQAGLAVPVDLYASMGAYEFSPLYPLTSLEVSKVKQLSKRLDEASFHCSLVLWLLGCTSSNSSNDNHQGTISIVDTDVELRNALVEHLHASANLAAAIGTLLQVERRQMTNDGVSKSDDCREQIILNSTCWDWNGDRACDGMSALQQLQEAQKDSSKAIEGLKARVMNNSHSVDALLLYSLIRDTTSGSRPIKHFMSDDDISKNSSGGTLGRLGDAALAVQTSWTGPKAVLNLFMHMSMINQVLDLLLSWWDGMSKILFCASNRNKDKKQNHTRKPLLRRRTLRRSIQWLVGTFGLYAMVTWWEEFRSWLGSSSTGPWTMVAFYVCFRPTVEETVQTALLRSVGHGLGALLAWIVNEFVKGSGGRMVIHAVVTLVLTWFIPTPFVYPSSISFFWDSAIGTGLIEGVLTTYHLVSSIVLNTDPTSASKARAASQCIGSFAAAIVSVLILPWWAEADAKRSLDNFTEEVSSSFLVLGMESTSPNKNNVIDAQSFKLKKSIDDLLVSRKALSSVLDSPGWIRCLLSPFMAWSFDKANDNNASECDTTKILEQKLVIAILGGVALESVMEKIKNTPDVVKNDPGFLESLKAGDIASVKASLCGYITSTTQTGEDDDTVEKEEQSDSLATLHVLMNMMAEVGLFPCPNDSGEEEEEPKREEDESV